MGCVRSVCGVGVLCWAGDYIGVRSGGKGLAHSSDVLLRSFFQKPGFFKNPGFSAAARSDSLTACWREK